MNNWKNELIKMIREWNLKYGMKKIKYKKWYFWY